MKRAVVVSVFCVTVLAQLGVPGWMIINHQRILAHGASYRFRTAPIDPYDPFRGRYVWLNLEGLAAPVEEGQIFDRGIEVYAYLDQDDEGYAHVCKVSPWYLADGSPLGPEAYIRAKVDYVYEGEVRLNIAIDRYYMREDLAPEAERAMWTRNPSPDGEGEVSAFVEVRVLKGNVALKELYLDGVPATEYVLNRINAGEQQS